MNIEYLENKIVSDKSRFEIKKNQFKELKKNFSKANILIIGAAGSIGKSFTLNLNNFDFNNLILMDNNETALADLTRDLNLTLRSKILNRIEYICEDITNINLKNFIKKRKISHYLNFAALKHVRSEENYLSTLNMFRTNSFAPFKIGKIKKTDYLKQIFFISTDKAANPSSLMGCSKKLMENGLFELRRKNKHLKVSTIRFANVSFSNGSLLQNIYNKVNENKAFGIPSNIKRYFITHKEAAHLCFKALLKESDNHIILPTYKSVGRMISLKEIAKKIVIKFNKKLIFSNKLKSIKKNEQLFIETKKNIIGQKSAEVFSEPNEKLLNFNEDNKLLKIQLYKNHNILFVEKKIKKSKNLNQIRNIFSKVFPSYNLKANKIKFIKLKDII